VASTEFKVKKARASSHNNDYMAVFPGDYSASNFADPTWLSDSIGEIYAAKELHLFPQ